MPGRWILERWIPNILLCHRMPWYTHNQRTHNMLDIVDANMCVSLPPQRGSPTLRRTTRAAQLRSRTRAPPDSASCK